MTAHVVPYRWSMGLLIDPAEIITMRCCVYGGSSSDPNSMKTFWRFSCFGHLRLTLVHSIG